MILIDLPRGRELAYLLKKIARKDGEQEFVRNCLVRLKGGMLTDEEAQIIRKRHEQYYGNGESARKR